MKSIRFAIFTSITVLLAAVLAKNSFAQQHKQNPEPIKIRWILAHEPIGLFQRAAKRFSAELESRAPGQVVIELLTLREYADKYNKGVLPDQGEVVNLMKNGNVEMSQLYTTTLGRWDNDLYALDLPFLFRDHEHAQKVLDGKIGKSLLAGLADGGAVRGLAFTYSGGYRVIPALTAIHKIEDFKGMKIRTSSSPVAEDTFLLLGAKPVVMDLEAIGSSMKQGLIQAAESTYPRFYSMRQNEFSKVLNDTKHSLFLTSIVVSDSFWKGLSPDLQSAIANAAQIAGRIERDEAIQDAEVTKAKCAQDGVQVVTLSPAEEAKFKSVTSSLYKKYKSYFTKGLVESIQQTR